MVVTGLDRIVADPSTLLGKRVGMLTNYTSVTSHLTRGVDALQAAGAGLVVLFGPEHGLTGTAQAGESEDSVVDKPTGLPLVDTYGLGRHLDDVIAPHRLDALVYDMQDIGVRYWTYTWSMYDAMAACARLGIEFIVLDRPNPLGGIRVEGPELDRQYSSFVGRTSTRQRHGLTAGELASLFNRADMPREAGQAAQLTVVTMLGWARSDSWSQTGLPWVMPSPNLPTPDSVWAFAATGLLEGTNASEGRGTTRPFELFGAPYVDDRFVPALSSLDLPGVAFRETFFRPTFHKHAGQAARGAQIYLTDPEAYRPVRTGVAIAQTLAELYPDDFAVLPSRQEADDDHAGFPLDRLWGSAGLRQFLEHTTTRLDGRDDLTTDLAYSHDALLYPDQPAC